MRLTVRSLLALVWVTSAFGQFQGASLGPVVTITPQGAKFAPLQPTDPPIEQIVADLLRDQVWRQVSVPHRGGHDDLATRLTCTSRSLGDKCSSQRETLAPGTQVQALVNKAGEVLQVSSVFQGMLVKVGDRYGAMQMQEFPAPRKVHVFLPRLGDPVRLSAGAKVLAVHPSNWGAVEVYVSQPNGQSARGQITMDVEASPPLKTSVVIRPVLNTDREVTAPSTETALVWRSASGEFAVTRLSDFQAASGVSAMSSEWRPSLLGATILVSHRINLYQLPVDVASLLFLGMKSWNEGAVENLAHIEPGDSIQTVLSVPGAEPLKSFGGSPMVRTSEGLYGYIESSDYRNLLDEENHRQAELAAKKVRKQREAEAARRAAQAAAAAAAERAKAAAAAAARRKECMAVFNATANKKMADLTVREDQQVRSCQAEGLYSPK